MKYLFLASLAVLADATPVAAKETLKSPDGDITLVFDISAKGEPMYSLSYKGLEIVKPSLMGFDLKDATSLTSGFKQVKTARRSIDETWKPVWGENDSIANRYNYMTVSLSQRAGSQTDRKSVV